MFTLTPVEAFRAQVLLDEALKKIEFLASISTLTQPLERHELSAFIGNEISHVLMEQTQLERQYERLVIEKSELKGITNKVEASRMQNNIRQISQKLRESNKNLCRNLKANPSIQGNLLKLQHERMLIEEWYRETKQQLAEEFSFYGLAEKIEVQIYEQELLNEVKKKDKETSQAVRILEAEIQRESAQHEKESTLANSEILSLKEQLQRDKLKSSNELSFAEKQLKASESVLLRMFGLREQELRKQLEHALADEDLENSAHSQAVSFLEKYINDLQEDKLTCQEAYVLHAHKMDQEIQSHRVERASVIEALNNLRARKSSNLEDQYDNEQEPLTILLKSEQNKRAIEAARVITTYGKLYLKRLAEQRVQTEMPKPKKKTSKKKK